MLKRYLPVLFAFIIALWSCTKPAAETASTETTDTTAVGALPPSEDPANDTAYNGDTQGDFFFNDTSVAVINGANEEGTDESEEEDDEKMVSVHETEIDVCGFSDDGKYFAFTQIVPGELDGGKASVFIIDVAKNEWATKPPTVGTDQVDDNTEDVKKQLQAVRDPLLSKYGITYHKNVGKEYKVKETMNNTVSVQGKPWAIVLTVDGLLIDLRAKDATTRDILLQKDKSVPKSRGSVRRYQLNKVFVFGDKISAFVEYDTEIMRDYENYQYYDRKNIAVTGVIK